MSGPLALDTNLLLRLLTNGETDQAQRVADLIDVHAAWFVPITVVLELQWVLRGAYRLDRTSVIAALEALMAIRQVAIEEDDLGRQALACHRVGMDFADAPHRVRSAGCSALVTWDRECARLAAAHQLSPAAGGSRAWLGGSGGL